jgi:hypothetical protein
MLLLSNSAFQSVELSSASISACVGDIAFFLLCLIILFSKLDKNNHILTKNIHAHTKNKFSQVVVVAQLRQKLLLTALLHGGAETK